MQDIPGYPETNEVVHPSVTVQLNGVDTPVSEVTITRELASDLPAQATTASGIVGATGSVRWKPKVEFSDKIPHPWSGEPDIPPVGAACDIDFRMNGVAVPKLRGFIKRSGGSFKEGSVTSSVIDSITKLNQPVSFPAHMISMPPYEEHGPFIKVNNEPTFTHDRVLRAVGFYATPPLSYGAVFSAPYMGSAWPEVGLVISSSKNGLPDPPAFRTTQWGVGTNSCDCYYTPDFSRVGHNGRLNKTLQLTLKADERKEGTSGRNSIRAYWGNDYVELSVNGGRDVEGSAWKNGAETTVVTMLDTVASTAEVFTLRVTSAGVFTILADNGAIATGATPWTIPATMADNNMTQVGVRTPHLTAVTIGGLQVSFGTENLHTAPNTAVLTSSAWGHSLPIMPAIKKRPALEVLKEASQAECASWWLDELGVLRWKNRKRLREQEPVETITGLQALDLSWDSNDAGVRSRVVLKSDRYTINRFDVSTVTLWTGSGETLRSGDVHTEIIGPPNDEEWFGVNNTQWGHTELNRGEMTMIGGVVSKEGVPDQWAFDVGKLTWTVEYLSADTIRLTHYVGNLGAGEVVILKTAENDPFLRPFRRDKPLPIIRGKGRARRSDVYTTGAHYGPDNAAALEHFVGPWVQDEDVLQELANDISWDLAVARPTINDMPVLPDWRRQLGDVVWLEDPKLRISIKVMLTKITDTVNNGTGKASQVLSGLILDLGRTATNLELDLHAAEYTNAEFDSVWGAATNAEMDADPLTRG